MGGISEPSTLQARRWFLTTRAIKWPRALGSTAASAQLGPCCLADGERACLGGSHHEVNRMRDRGVMVDVTELAKERLNETALHGRTVCAETPCFPGSLCA